MSSLIRTFRIFISSTSSNLKTECVALQEAIFSKPKKLYQQYGYQFQAIDLRWGIKEQDALYKKRINKHGKKNERGYKLR